MLVEGDSGVALLRRELKRLLTREAREVRKRERATEVGAVREIAEPGFHDRPEAECMFPVDVGDKVLEIHGVLRVVQRVLPASAVERAEHQNRGRVAHTANLLRPRPEVEANLVGEIREELRSPRPALHGSPWFGSTRARRDRMPPHPDWAASPG